MAKILVVDDHPQILRLLQFELERDGHQVLTAEDGEEALRKVCQERPDMVVLDIILPKMDGYEVLRAVKSDPATRHINVVMLTILDQDGAIAHGMHLGADWYLAKPFSAGEVAAVARRFLCAVTR